MQGLMQDYPLTLQHIFWRIEKLFGKKEIVTKREDGVHRYTYGDCAARVKRLANVLTTLGIAPGDRVGTLAWNNYRHLELYYAVPCMGAVLHTLNLRLFPEQLAFVINDAADKIIFVDKSILPILARIADKIPCVEKIVVLSDGGELPRTTSAKCSITRRCWPPPRRTSPGRRSTSATPPRCATPPARPAIPRGWSTPTARSSSTRCRACSAIPSGCRERRDPAGRPDVPRQ